MILYFIFTEVRDLL